MNTLLFTLEYPPFKGGVANYYGNLVKFWPSLEKVFVLHNNDNKPLKPHWLFSFFKLKKEIKNKKINHIIVGHILPLGTVAYYVSKFTKTPYTVILHGMDFTYALRQPRKRKMAKKILNKAKNIICSNSYTAGLVKEFLGEENAKKIHTVNPGISELQITNYKIEITKLKKRYNLDNKLILFSIGRLVKRKGFDMVVKAMPQVVKSVPNLYYFMAGDGPDKKYIYDLAKGAPNIIFLGKITDEEKWTWLNLCDIFIMPSRKIGDDFEGFGIVYLEANLRGKPVIAGDSGGVRDAVKGAYSGILVDPKKTEAITNAIITFAKNPELRKKLGEQGRERAMREFRWEDKIKKIYNLVTHNYR